ncbi:hypothetical protein [Aestuariivivens sediminis]|uniref:hypothetical protein n=1 Tax=Aestuariivivens sediminis TaxID=2913557 RepID=UPI001F57577A|nr:hypothetical protein [Aestuariivivens sediminis]
MILSDILLKSKDLTPAQKLVLGLILNENPMVLQLAGGYNKTCGEMGKLIGLSRDRVRKALDALVENGYVISEYGTGWRKTNLTSQGENYRT